MTINKNGGNTMKKVLKKKNENVKLIKLYNNECSSNTGCVNTDTTCGGGNTSDSNFICGLVNKVSKCK